MAAIALAIGNCGLAAASEAQPAIDPALAVNAPDRFAWDLFVELNRPALEGGRGVADPRKRIGDAGPRVWETWKLTTPVGGEVFLESGRRPAAWDSDPVGHSGNIRGQARKVLSPPKFRITDPLPVKEFGIESRINRPGFEFIVAEGLFSIDGQERFRASGRPLEFPIDTIAIKATWRRLAPDEIQQHLEQRYYTATDADGHVYGLTGLHLTTKAIPNWFWATFEQVDNPPPEIADRDRYTQVRFSGAASAAEARLRDVPAPLKGTVWEYYVLRGTQADFTDAAGRPVILGNTQMEGGIQKTASCMTCHARATIGERPDPPPADGRHADPPGRLFDGGGNVDSNGANRLTVDPNGLARIENPEIPASSANGAPDPNWFFDPATGRSRYTQLDFLWEFTFARREK